MRGNMTVKRGHRPDYVLLASICLLVIGGLAILASASSDLGEFRFGDSYFYLKHQILYGLLFGIAGFFLASKIHYRTYRKFALLFLILNLFLLLLIFTPLGITTGGATRWISVGPVTFQPSEFLKLSFILYLAAWLDSPKKERKSHFWQGFVPFIVVSGVTAGLLILQPATSMVVILLSAAMVVYFLSGARMRYILAAMGAGILVLGLVIVATPYRLSRVTSFLNPTDDLTGANYHREQALITLGSGGVFGIGYGQGGAKVNYLPAVIDDSIFAVAGQELGFIGAGTILVLFAIVVFRMFWLAARTSDGFGKLILAGFGTIIAFQSIVNIGAISGFFPLTGIPLPFISYGGTALAVFLTMSGVAANISKFS